MRRKTGIAVFHCCMRSWCSCLTNSAADQLYGPELHSDSCCQAGCFAAVRHPSQTGPAAAASCCALLLNACCSDPSAAGAVTRSDCSPMGPHSSTGSPMTFMMRPRVPRPTGTCMYTISTRVVSPGSDLSALATARSCMQGWFTAAH